MTVSNTLKLFYLLLFIRTQTLLIRLIFRFLLQLVPRWKGNNLFYCHLVYKTIAGNSLASTKMGNVGLKMSWKSFPPRECIHDITILMIWNVLFLLSPMITMSCSCRNRFTSRVLNTIYLCLLFHSATPHPLHYRLPCSIFYSDLVM